jgi:uracil phosphoribosyltransferase
MNTMTKQNVNVIDHPLALQLLTKLRDVNTPTVEFRRSALLLSQFLAYEAMRDLTKKEAAVETPVGPGIGVVIPDYVVVAPILRAGLVLAQAAQEIIPPTARVYHIGLKRDEATLQAISYYNKLPDKLPSESKVYVLDPMLATGGSAVAAIDLFVALNVKDIQLVSFLAAPEGIQRVHEKHPKVKITVASIDKCLNEHGYIVPGLGDAGDRIFGTIH